MQHEKEISATSGYTMAIVAAVVVIISLVGIMYTGGILTILAVPILLFLLRGFFMVNPNGSCVMTLFGE